MERTQAQVLAVTAQRARLLALDMVHTAASGHIGGSLSVMDLLTTLYFHQMRIDPKAPGAPGRSSPRATAPRPSMRFWPCGATSPSPTAGSSAPSRATTPATRT